jgi:hypothetical protein
MQNNVNYIPKPSRVQNPCIFATNTPYTDAFIPEKTENLPPAEAILRNKELYKAVVLKNTNNTSRITKNQKYAQIAKCLGPSRTKTFGTQSQTYSNPNTTNLTRVGYTVADYNNQIVGKPNNFAGPFQINIPNPYGCLTTGIEQGGNLLCDLYGNPCSGGLAENNKPEPPTLVSANPGCGLITLIWEYTNTLSITNFNIYQRTNNGNTTLIISLSNMVRTYVVNNLLYYNTYSFFITALNNTTESVPSNTISATPTQIGPPIGFTGSSGYSNGCPIINLTWQPPNANNNCLATLTSYNIYDSNSVLITSVPSSQNSYMVTKNLTFDSSYNFKIISAGTNYAKSNDVSLNPLIQTGYPLPPNNFKIYSVNCSNITLSWKPWPTNCISSYNVYCADPSRSYYKSQNIPNSNSSILYCTFTDLSYSTTYDFSINSLSTITSSYVSCTATTPVPNNIPIINSLTISTKYIPGISVSWSASPNDCYVTSWGILYRNDYDTYNFSIPNTGPSNTGYYTCDISNVQYSTSTNIITYSVQLKSQCYGYDDSLYSNSYDIQMPIPYTQINATTLGTDPSKTILLFDGANNFAQSNITFGYDFSINLLIIGGGSGGSSGHGTGQTYGGGGGGGGGIVYKTLIVQGSSSNTYTYNINIGKGGAGGIGQSNRGIDGSNSSFYLTLDASYTATGALIQNNNSANSLGGYGYFKGILPNSSGGNGGYGCIGITLPINGSNSSDVSINIFDSSYNIYCGGGGGGGGKDYGGNAGAGVGGNAGGYTIGSGAGQNASSGADITGKKYYYGGGGGGGSLSGSSGGNGGNGGNGAVILWWYNTQIH